MNPAILKNFGLAEDSQIDPLTSGLINSTWKITDGEREFVLQQVNTNVFRKPYDLAANIRMLDEYLKKKFSKLLIRRPTPAMNGKSRK